MQTTAVIATLVFIFITMLMSFGLAFILEVKIDKEIAKMKKERVTNKNKKAS